MFPSHKRIEKIPGGSSHTEKVDFENLSERRTFTDTGNVACLAVAAVEKRSARARILKSWRLF